MDQPVLAAAFSFCSTFALTTGDRHDGNTVVNVAVAIVVSTIANLGCAVNDRCIANDIEFVGITDPNAIGTTFGVGIGGARTSQVCEVFIGLAVAVVISAVATLKSLWLAFTSVPDKSVRIDVTVFTCRDYTFASVAGCAAIGGIAELTFIDGTIAIIVFSVANLIGWVLAFR